MWSIVVTLSLISLICCQRVDDLDKDMTRTSPELIESRGFQSESHTVVTEDGYVLTIFRIINPYINPEVLNQSKPVLLWHGMILSSDAWLISTPGLLNTNGVYSEANNSVANNCNNSLTSTLAYTLAACGYDVWLGNTRGNEYSKRHLYLKNLSPEYNDYTLTEISIYDKPAVINYIMALTQQDSVSYIGHSMSTTSMIILLSLQPDYEQYIKPFIALAPEVYLSNIRSSAAYVPTFEVILRGLRFPIGLTAKMTEILYTLICGTPLRTERCIEIIFKVFGSDWTNTDRNRFPVYMYNSFNPLSTRVFAHYSQIYNTKGFKQFNYPTAEINHRKYGQSTPPDYPITAIKSRNMAFIQGLNDFTSDFQDINRFTNSLKVPLLLNYTIPFTSWNHLDFIWGIHTNIYLNPVIFQILDYINQRIETVI